MSAGELFELIMPAAIVVAALLSTFVLASARKRFSLVNAAALAIGTLLLPLIVFPLYLVIIVWRKPARPPQKWRYILPLLYAAIILTGIGVYYYFDSRTVDAYLARAEKAKLVDDYTTAIREYRGALTLEENPHTRKLLAIQLVQGGYLTEALGEFRVAQAGGEPDDTIYYLLGRILERLNQVAQAKLEYQNFLLSNTCMQPDLRCEDARRRMQPQEF
jgi:tetratricopeptide (TPR) repeat protein